MNIRLLKKVTTVIVLLCTFLVVSSAVAEATIIDSGTCGENVTWTLDDQGTLTISGSGAVNNSVWHDNADIRSVIIEDGVTSIGDYAFSKCNKLASISIPSSINSIGYRAFEYCTIAEIHTGSLEQWLSFDHYDSWLYFYGGNSKLYIGNELATSITIPSGITSIGSEAFYGCRSLTSIIIPNSVKSIGTFAFNCCTNLTSITIPDSVTDIGDGAFEGCTHLAGINLPDSVKSIEADLFYGCSGLTSITIPDGVTSINNSAFSECSGLASITIPNSVTNIEDSAFDGCNSLYEIHVDSVQQWLGYNHKGTKLYPHINENGKLYIGNELATSITIPDGVTSIDGYAFRNCTSLLGITIPESVTVIDDTAFMGDDLITIYCNNDSYADIWANDHGIRVSYLDKIIDRGSCGAGVTWTLDDQRTLTISGNGKMEDYLFTTSPAPWNDYYDIVSVEIKYGVTRIGNYAFRNCSRLTSITLPDSITDIGSSAFTGCNHLSSITIPDSVINIGSGAFAACSSLSGITIPDKITCIEDYTFEGCNNLASIVIPDSVTSIGYGAFSECSRLVSITIPDSVTRIGTTAFYNCSKLNEIHVDSIEQWLSYNQGDSSLYLHSADGTLYIGNSLATSITIPGGITSIGDYAFKGCGNLTSITIPDSVTSIGNEAFRDCTNLTKISIPDSIVSIGSLAFYNCYKLSSITIPDSVTSIERGAFAECTQLNDIRVDSIGQWLSYDHSNTSLYPYSGVDGKLYINNVLATSIIIPTGSTSIGSETFRNCTYLSNITIPSSVSRIGNYAFSNCINLTSITIPNSVSSIEDSTFHACRSLASITIPDSVTNIDDYAFSECRSLTVYCYEFSHADTWATNKGYPCRYLDEEIVPVNMSLPETFVLPKGESSALPLGLFPDAAYDVTWSSSDSFVVSVSNGTVTGLNKGTVTITAICKRSDETTLTASCVVTCYVPLESFSLDPSEVWIPAKESYQINTILVPSDAEEQFVYTSLNNTLATVSETGLVTTKGVGDVMVTVTAQNRQQQTLLLHSCYPVQSISFSSDKVAVGNEPIQLQSKVTTKGGDYVNKLISFASSDPDIASVDENGTVYPQGTGVAVITAAASNGVTASCEVAVGYNGHFPVTVVGAVEPTCTVTGSTAEIVCFDCGMVLSASEVIPALEHDIVTHEAQAPTCIADGWDTYETCSRCDYTTQVIIPALGHDTVTHDAKSVTCTSDGWDIYETCSRCGYTTYTEIPALGHDTVPHEAKAPTCVDIGWEAYETCNRCDYTTYIELPAVGHVVVNDVFIAPTRTTWGKTSGTHCEACGEILSGNEPLAPLTDEAVVAIPRKVEAIAEEAYCGSGVVIAILPNGCITIGARAFAQCSSLQIVEIPASVTDIATDTFDGSDSVIIVTSYNSAAMKYAIEHGINFLIITK